MRIPLLALATLAILSACDHDDTPYVPPFSHTSYTLHTTTDSSTINSNIEQETLAEIKFRFSGAQIQTPHEEPPNRQLTISAPDFTITLDDIDPITTSTYTGKTWIGNDIRAAQMTYTYNGLNYTTDYTSPNASVTITHISCDSLKGSFNAQLSCFGYPDITLSQGQFSLYWYDR